jgi:hypothetical protein
MLAKKHDPFISLKDKRDAPEAMPMDTMKEEPPRGPTLYINDIDLLIADEDLNNSLTAEVKITPRQIRKTVTNGETKVSYDLEITGIRFKS